MTKKTVWISAVLCQKREKSHTQKWLKRKLTHYYRLYKYITAFVKCQELFWINKNYFSLTNNERFVIILKRRGELSEWSKVQHSKCCVPKRNPGFESLTLRKKRKSSFEGFRFLFIMGFEPKDFGVNKTVRWTVFRRNRRSRLLLRSNSRRAVSKKRSFFAVESLALRQKSKSHASGSLFF